MNFGELPFQGFLKCLWCHIWISIECYAFNCRVSSLPAQRQVVEAASLHPVNPPSFLMRMSAQSKVLILKICCVSKLERF